MKRWELEVTDGLTAWRCRGRTYYPGVYVVTDERVVKDARQTHYGVHIRPLDDEEEVVVGGVVADGETRPEALVAPQGEGPMTVGEMRTLEETQTCLACGRDYKNREQHYRMKPDHRPAEEGVPAPDLSGENQGSAAAVEVAATPDVDPDQGAVPIEVPATEPEGQDESAEEPEPSPGEPVAVGDGS